MSKHITEWKPNEKGEIEKVVYIDGEVMPEDWEQSKSAWEAWNNFWSFVSSVIDNGRVYNPNTGNWEYNDCADYMKSPDGTWDASASRLVVIEGGSGTVYGADTASDSGL